MKKKITLFASTLLAAVLMATSAFAAEGVGDVNGDGNITVRDAALTLKQALSKDYAGSAAALSDGFIVTNSTMDIANADEDKPFANTNEITANDAALIYKLATEQTALYLKLVGSDRNATFRLAEDENTTVKAVVETYLAKKAAITRNQSRAANNVDKLKFGITVSGKKRDAKITNQDGWNIFTNAINSLFVDPLFKADATLEEVVDGTAKLTTSSVAAKVDQYSLPNNDIKAMSGDEFFAYVNDGYNAALEVLKHTPSAQDVKDAKNGIADVVGDKYKVSATFKYNNEAKAEYHYNGKADDTTDALIDALAPLYNYDTVTIGDVYNKCAEIAGITPEDLSQTKEFGAIEVKVNKRDVDVVLVREAVANNKDE